VGEMNKILTIIQKSDKNAFERWGVNRNTTFQHKDYVQFETKAGKIKINYDAIEETYHMDTFKGKIEGLYYDQVIDAIDKIVA
jgi:hypothetical protein